MILYRNIVPFLFIVLSIFIPVLSATSTITSALYIPKVMEYTNTYKARNACRIAIIYDKKTIKDAIELKRNMQYKTVPRRSLIVKLITYKKFSQQKAISLDAVYLFISNNNIIKAAQKEDVIIFANKKSFLKRGALIYISNDQYHTIILNKKAFNKIHQSFNSSFLKIVKPYYD